MREDVEEWFEYNTDSPYMLTVAYIQRSKRLKITAAEESILGIEKLHVQRSKLTATTHVDYSARIQTVRADTNPRYHSLISKFYEKTGCPLVVNTSFNVRGEPIVCTPTDAFNCFMGIQLDIIAVGNYLLRKDEQDETLKKNYMERYALD